MLCNVCTERFAQSDVPCVKLGLEVPVTLYLGASKG